MDRSRPRKQRDSTRTNMTDKSKSEIQKNDPDRVVNADSPPGQTQLTMAQQIARAASAFEQERTGIIPTSVTVVQCDGTLVITLHGALSPAERALANTAAGAAQVQEFHRHLFANASNSLRQEIKRITGVDVREAAVEVEPTSGALVGVFTTGTTVQVYLMAQDISAESWNRGIPDKIV